ncbi:hypothetical protein GTP91_06990 [Rugamonas sp. FT82W]|uniref:Novel STAND NTPase 5 domain-containing protein n=1 Tax=Duganella vulcania TaxID=2692166 RepID=A0A845FZB8_9BURK|nr:SIR2 family protein [Duganella vulcania]MYM86931.1 hypothetical protein [Duganella vulcania]
MINKEDLQRLKVSLFSGRYNLLVGAGISLDSTELDGSTFLPSGGAFLGELESLKGVKGRPLTKVYQLLSDDEKHNLLTKRFSNTIPGKTVKLLPNFIWNQVYTFNIDDALELAYGADVSAKQKIVPINFNEPFSHAKPSEQLQIVHLHGYSRQPSVGYVFSQTEYAHISKSQNPWMMVLSQTLATESFIISGTSLSEPDLEFYLSHRTVHSGRSDRGPSILVEPYPDAVTESDCRRHGLLLVKSTLVDFLNWLKSELGDVPTLETVTIPSFENLFSPDLSTIAKISFFSSVDRVEPVATNQTGKYSGFFFGQQPTWQDLQGDIDVSVYDTPNLVNKIQFFLKGGAAPFRVIALIGDAGTGKTTNLRRVAYDLAKDGRTIFFLKRHADVNYDDMLACFRALTGRCALFIDGAAENVGFIRLLLEKEELGNKIMIVIAERAYRLSHLKSNLEEFDLEYRSISGWKIENYVQLIETFRDTGLLASSEALKNSTLAAKNLSSDPVAIGTCRLLNSFRPFEKVVRSLWDDASDDQRRTYLTASVAEFCVPDGLKYSLLQATQKGYDIEKQFESSCSLPLGYSTDDTDYIFPLNATIGGRILDLSTEIDKEMLLDVFVDLANVIAPYVNRRAIIHRTSEARLSGRLFHSEDVVTRFLGDLSEKFYIKTKKNWEWNSRYWEQRAIELSSRNLLIAIQHARQAVAIEGHPFPWTTLASLLIRKMTVNPEARDLSFSEAFGYLIKALDFESGKLRRHNGHAYTTLFRGADRFYELGGKFTKVDTAELISRMSDAEVLLKRNSAVQNAREKLASRLHT